MPVPLPEISPPPSKRRRTSHSPDENLAVSSSPPPRLPLDASQLIPNINDTSSIRIFSWNVNGIEPFLPPSTPDITSFLNFSSSKKLSPVRPSLRANLQRWNWPQILFLQEVKIAPKDTKTPALLRRIVNTPLENEGHDVPKDRLFDTHLSLPRDKYNATGFGGKVYGVATFVRQDLSPTVVVKDGEWDLEGRVQIVEISSIKLVVINVYAVNGTTNDYRDPDTGKIVGDRHNRKRAVHSLLPAQVKEYEERGWNTVLAGDINISRSNIDSFPQLRMGEDHVKNRADFEAKFIWGLGMLDTFRLVHGDEKKYSYRPRNKPWGAGGDRVDLILLTKGLRGCVNEMDMLDNEKERGPSDHVPLFIELNVMKDEKDIIR